MFKSVRRLIDLIRHYFASIQQQEAMFKKAQQDLDAKFVKKSGSPQDAKDE